MLANDGGFLYDSDMTDQTTESVPNRPCKRWRKTKWFYGILLAYCAVTIAAVIWWSAYSHRVFDEVVNPIIARGEPLAWSDFATDPIPDDQNAAILYKRAIDTPVLMDFENVLQREFGDLLALREWECYDLTYEFIRKREVRQEHPDELRKLLGMARDAFVLCRKARRIDNIHWGIDFTGKALDESGPPGEQLYIKLSGLLHLAVIDAHDGGRDDDAVEYIRDLVALGDSLATYPSLISNLTSLAINYVANRAIEDIVTTMKIGDTQGNASLKNTRALIARLLDDTPARQGMILAMLGERSMNYDICMSILSLDPSTEETGSAFGGGIGDYYSSSGIVRACYDYCLAPLFRIDGTWALKRLDSYVRVSDFQTLPEYRNAIKQTERDTEEYLERPSYLRHLSTIMMPTLDRLRDIHYRYLAGRQMAGVALAIRIYQIERGRLPDTLGQLVPDYLADVPQDPMAEPGNPIRYVNDPKVTRLYCVGLNGRDDLGAYDDFASTRMTARRLCSS